MQRKYAILGLLVLGIGALCAFVAVRAQDGKGLVPAPVVPPDKAIHAPLPLEELDMPLTQADKKAAQAGAGQSSSESAKTKTPWLWPDGPPAIPTGFKTPGSTGRPKRDPKAPTTFASDKLPKENEAAPPPSPPGPITPVQYVAPLAPPVPPIAPAPAAVPKQTGELAVPPSSPPAPATAQSTPAKFAEDAPKPAPAVLQPAPKPVPNVAAPGVGQPQVPLPVIVDRNGMTSSPYQERVVPIPVIAETRSLTAKPEVVYPSSAWKLHPEILNGAKPGEAKTDAPPFSGLNDPNGASAPKVVQNKVEVMAVPPAPTFPSVPPVVKEEAPPPVVKQEVPVAPPPSSFPAVPPSVKEKAPPALVKQEVPVAPPPQSFPAVPAVVKEEAPPPVVKENVPAVPPPSSFPPVPPLVKEEAPPVKQPAATAPPTPMTVPEAVPPIVEEKPSAPSIPPVLTPLAPMFPKAKEPQDIRPMPPAVAAPPGAAESKPVQETPVPLPPTVQPSAEFIKPAPPAIPAVSPGGPAIPLPLPEVKIVPGPAVAETPPTPPATTPPAAIVPPANDKLPIIVNGPIASKAPPLTSPLIQIPAVPEAVQVAQPIAQPIAQPVAQPAQIPQPNTGQAVPVPETEPKRFKLVRPSPQTDGAPQKSVPTGSSTSQYPPAEIPGMKLVTPAMGQVSERPAKVAANPPASPPPTDQVVTINKLGPTAMKAGELLSFEIVLRNASNVPQLIRVEEDLPRGTRFLRSQPMPVSQNGKLVWSLGNLGVGAEQRIKVELRAMVAGSCFSETVVMATPNGPAPTPPAQPKATLNVQVRGPIQAQISEPAIFDVIISNPSAHPARNVVLHVRLSEGLHHSQGRQIEGDLGTLAPGAEKNIQLRTQAVQAGAHGLEVLVTADDAAKAGARAGITIGGPGGLGGAPVIRDQVNQVGLQVQQNAQGLQLQQNPTHRLIVGQPNEIRIEVVNNSPHPLRQIAVVDTLPEEIEFIGAGDKGAWFWSTRSVQWIIDLGPGQMKTLTMQVEPKKTGQWGHEVSARAGAGPEVRSTGVFHAEGFANLSLRIAGRDPQVEVGKETVYQIRVVNHGNALATNVVVAVQLSDGLAAGHLFQGATPHRVQGKQIIFAPLAKLDPHGEAVFTIGVVAQAPGDRRVRAQTTSDQTPTPVSREERTLVYRD